MRILSRQDVDALISMQDVIAAMREVFADLARGAASVPERTVLSMPGTDNSVLFMPGLLAKSGSVGVKVVSVFPTDAARGIPTISAQILLCDSETGVAKALLEGGRITALRTAATTALATQYLAREESSRLGVFGAGVQAKAQVESHLVVRPLARIAVFDMDKKRAATLVSDVRSLVEGKCECVAAESPAEILGTSDIIIAATTSHTPVFDGKSVREGTHINAIGSFKPEVREVDDTTVKRARLFVDSYEHALNEAGDLIMPMKSGIIKRDDIRAELGELIVGSKKGREQAREITFFKSVGMAVQDIAVAELAYRRACERSLGLEV